MVLLNDKSAFAGWLLLISLVAAVIALALFGWLADEVVRGATLRFDLQLRSAVHSLSSRQLTTAMLIVTSMGAGIFLLAATGLAVVAFLSFGWHRAAIWLLIAMAGAGVLNAAMKLSFHRLRPAPFFGYALPGSESFPSGHALASLCFYGVVAALCAARVHTRPLRWSIWIAAAVLVATIGFSRIYLSVHYFSDVLGGYLAATVWLGALIFTDRYYARKTKVSARRM